MDDVEEALGRLEAASSASSSSSRRHLLACCAAMRNAIADARADAPSTDTLALMDSLPEALVSCRPPSIALGAPAAAAAGGEPEPLPAALAAALGSWEFNLHEVAAADLPRLCYWAMLEHTEVVELGIDRPKLWAFVQAVASRYRDNPFHSFRHAVDVTLGASCLLRMLQRAGGPAADEMKSDPLFVCATLFAAMVHDTDHPGVMNPFLIATRHPLAVLYNERSVLENHHCATAIALLGRPELDFLSPLPPDKRARVRKVRRAAAPRVASPRLASRGVASPTSPHPTSPPLLASPRLTSPRLSRLQLMIGLVLATDVTTHIPFMKDFNAAVAAGTPVGAEKATQLCLKAADISNPTRPIGVYETWVEGVMAEFFAQGDAEKALGLPVSMNCDRDTVDVNKCQVGFISFIVGPIFEGFAKAVPEISEVCLKALAANKAHYQAKAA